MRVGRWRSLLAPAAAFGWGAAVPLIVVGWYFLDKGAWPDLWEALFVYAPQYTALSLRRSGVMELVQHTLQGWPGFSLLDVVGVLLLVGLPAVHPRERAGALHVAGVIAFPLAGVALQAKFFAYHYDAVLALTALLAGWGLWKLWMTQRATWHGAVSTVLLVGLLLYVGGPAEMRGSFVHRCQMRLTALLVPERRADINDQLYTAAEVNAGTNRRVADWLRSHTPAQSTVYIWGFEPVIYMLAQRTPASRYIYNVPQRTAWRGERNRRILMAELTASRPAAIAVEHGDQIPWVTGNGLDSAKALQNFLPLEHLIADDYRYADKIGSFALYLRRTSR